MEKRIKSAALQVICRFSFESNTNRGQESKAISPTHRVSVTIKLLEHAMSTQAQHDRVLAVPLLAGFPLQLKAPRTAAGVDLHKDLVALKRRLGSFFVLISSQLSNSSSLVL